MLEYGELAAGEACLQTVEQTLTAPPFKPIIADEAQWQILPAALTAARAYHALAEGDMGGTVRYAQQTVELFPDQAHRWRQIAHSLLGLTHWCNGDLPQATQAFANLTASYLKLGRLVDAISTAFVQAVLEFSQGDLNRAEHTTQQMLQVVIRHGEPLSLGTPDLYRVLSELARERGQMLAAQNQLERAASLGEQTGFTNWTHRLCLTQSRLKQSQGDWEAALTLLDEAEAVFIENPVPVVQPIAALRAKIWLRQGALDKATAWAQRLGLTVHDDLSYLREFEYLTFARLLLAQARHRPGRNALDQAQTLLSRLLIAAESGGQNGRVIEILILQAVAHGAQDDRAKALLSLKRALHLAEPQGYVRLFVDEGAYMAELLAQLRAEPDHNPPTAYLDRLLTACGKSVTSQSASSSQTQSLVEPLSPRELEILALITTGLRNKEIAEQLVISLNTVLYHIKNIYGKLGVNKRALAIAKARDLGLA